MFGRIHEETQHGDSHVEGILLNATRFVIKKEQYAVALFLHFPKRPESRFEEKNGELQKPLS